ncbi:hypothetical protein AAHA92_32852 [Salvia divinorum]|uniref:Uncharacterized protein n=1 Tax=Salvia divinorum TaxID=28513 RepID=A0ABD1FM37_SALDI
MSDRDRRKTDDGADEGAEWKCKRCGRKGKRPPFFRLRKSKKLLHQSGICRQPKTLDSSGESPTSDPNSPDFTFDDLRALIEKNDFYSKDCNPHLDR